jgi:hypothetical protein
MDIPECDPAKGRDYFNQLSLMRSSGAFKEKAFEKQISTEKKPRSRQGAGLFQPTLFNALLRSF